MFIVAGYIGDIQRCAFHQCVLLQTLHDWVVPLFACNYASD